MPSLLDYCLLDLQEISPPGRVSYADLRPTEKQVGLAEHAEIDCDLGRDFAPINQHYGGLQSLSATGVTYVPDVNPGVQSQACNRGLATYASLPTSLEGRNCHS